MCINTLHHLVQVTQAESHKLLEQTVHNSEGYVGYQCGEFFVLLNKNYATPFSQ